MARILVTKVLVKFSLICFGRTQICIIKTLICGKTRAPDMDNPIENKGLFTSCKNRFSGKGKNPMKLGCLKNCVVTFYM